MWQLEGKRPPSDMVLMEMLSREYGWLPDEIRGIRMSDIRAYTQIISTRNKIEQKNLKKHKR